MEITVEIAGSEYACCGEDLWPGKRVSWPIAYLYEDGMYKYVLELHDQYPDSGAQVFKLDGVVVSLRERRRERGLSPDGSPIRSFRELDKVAQSTDVDLGECLEVALRLSADQPLPRLFSMSSVGMLALGQGAGEEDELFELAKQRFVQTPLHRELTALGRNAVHRLGRGARVDDLGSVVFVGAGSFGVGWCITLAHGPNWPLRDMVVLNIADRSWQLELDEDTVHLLRRVFQALANLKVRTREPDTPAEQILDAEGILCV